MTNYRKEFNLVLRTLVDLTEEIMYGDYDDLGLYNVDLVYNTLKELADIRNSMGRTFPNRSTVNYGGVRYKLKHDELGYVEYDDTVSRTVKLKVKNSPVGIKVLYLRIEYDNFNSEYKINIDGFKKGEDYDE